MKHMYPSIKKHLVSILVCQLVIISANSQWSTDPNVNNAICISTGDQINHVITSDGSGGAIIAWADQRNFATNSNDIVAQRISADGIVQWTENGIGICTELGSQMAPQIISDGSGGAIIIWNDFRTTGLGSGLYVQKVNSAGVSQWTAGGVLMKSVPGTQNDPAITSDGSGGAIITWDTFVSGSRYNIYAMKINTSGVIQWSSNVCLDPLEQQFPQITADGSGGAIIIWSDARPGINNNDLYAQRLNSDGVAQWATNGIVFCAAPKHPGEAHLISDNLGGAIIVWADYRRRDFARDIYAQRIDLAGAVQWTTDGIAIYNTGTGDYISPRIIVDGSGGAFIVFESAGSGIIGQRVNSLGELQWGAGVNLGAGTWPQLTNSNSGDAIAAWHNDSNGKVYAQKLNTNGVASWTAGGVTVSNKVGKRPQLVSDGNGGTIINWWDNRNTLTSINDIYAQNVNTSGNLGNLVTYIIDQPASIQDGVLSQNFPNPFKQNTKIRYEIVSKQLVSLIVSDLSGKEIKTLVNEEQPAGIYEVDFDGSKITSGTYIIKFKSGILNQTKKMILMK
jgi:hypothetical protein